MSGRWASSNRRHELPSNWPDIVRTVKRRDPACTWPGCDQPATDVDHIGNKHDHRLGNLRGLCSPHHRERTASQARAAHAAAYAKAKRPTPVHPALR